MVILKGFQKLTHTTLYQREKMYQRENIPRRNTNKNYNNSNQFKDCIDLNPPKNGYSPMILILEKESIIIMLITL